MESSMLRSNMVVYILAWAIFWTPVLTSQNMLGAKPILTLFDRQENCMRAYSPDKTNGTLHSCWYLCKGLPVRYDFEADGVSCFTASLELGVCNRSRCLKASDESQQQSLATTAKTIIKRSFGTKGWMWPSEENKERCSPAFQRLHAFMKNCRYLCKGWPPRLEAEPDGTPCKQIWGKQGFCFQGRCQNKYITSLAPGGHGRTNNELMREIGGEARLNQVKSSDIEKKLAANNITKGSCISGVCSTILLSTTVPFAVDKKRGWNAKGKESSNTKAYTVGSSAQTHATTGSSRLAEAFTTKSAKNSETTSVHIPAFSGSPLIRREKYVTDSVPSTALTPVTSRGQTFERGTSLPPTAGSKKELPKYFWEQTKPSFLGGHTRNTKLNTPPSVCLKNKSTSWNKKSNISTPRQTVNGGTSSSVNGSSDQRDKSHLTAFAEIANIPEFGQSAMASTQEGYLYFTLKVIPKEASFGETNSALTLAIKPARYMAYASTTELPAVALTETEGTVFNSTNAQRFFPGEGVSRTEALHRETYVSLPKEGHMGNFDTHISTKINTSAGDTRGIISRFKANIRTSGTGAGSHLPAASRTISNAPSILFTAASGNIMRAETVTLPSVSPAYVAQHTRSASDTFHTNHRSHVSVRTTPVSILLSGSEITPPQAPKTLQVQSLSRSVHDQVSFISLETAKATAANILNANARSDSLQVETPAVYRKDTLADMWLLDSAPAKARLTKEELTAQTQGIERGASRQSATEAQNVEAVMPPISTAGRDSDHMAHIRPTETARVSSAWVMSRSNGPRKYSTVSSSLEEIKENAPYGEKHSVTNLEAGSTSEGPHIIFTDFYQKFALPS